MNLYIIPNSANQENQTHKTIKLVKNKTEMSNFKIKNKQYIKITYSLSPNVLNNVGQIGQGIYTEIIKVTGLELQPGIELQINHEVT